MARASRCIPASPPTWPMSPTIRCDRPERSPEGGKATMKNIGVTRRQIGLSALGLGAAALVAPRSAAAADRPLKWGFANSDLGTVDPIAIRTTNDDFLVRQIFQPLVSPPYGTGDMDLSKLNGELAESWEA